MDLRLGRAIPAIDLLGGRVVRLHQGRYDRATAFPVDPVELARRYAAAGAPWLHVVDLDAARTGTRSRRHARLLRRLRDVPGLRVQLGGGLRTGAQILVRARPGRRPGDGGHARGVRSAARGAGSRPRRAGSWSRSTASTAACARTAGCRTSAPMRPRSWAA